MNEKIPLIARANWEIFKVTEEKGLFDNYIGNKKELIGGRISTIIDYFNFKSIKVELTINGEKSYYKPIFLFRLITEFTYICEYRRKKNFNI